MFLASAVASGALPCLAVRMTPVNDVDKTRDRDSREHMIRSIKSSLSLSQVLVSFGIVKSCLPSLLSFGEWIWPMGDVSVGKTVGDLLGVCVRLLIDFTNSRLYHSLSDRSNGTTLFLTENLKLNDLLPFTTF